MDLVNFLGKDEIGLKCGELGCCSEDFCDGFKASI